MFAAGHDAANRNAVRSVEHETLNLVGLAMRADRKEVDKIVDKLKFHQWSARKREQQARQAVRCDLYCV